MNLLTYPARPVNGGHLKYALPKIGRWYYEPKYNGWRALVHVPTGTMWNRHGELLTIAHEFTAALELLKQTAFLWLDVEALERRHNVCRGTLIVLDCPSHGGAYVERRASLLDGVLLLHPYTTPANNAVYLTPSYTDHWNVWETLQDSNRILGCQFYEGLVAKRADSRYPIQLNNPDQATPTWMKHRFVK